MLTGPKLDGESLYKLIKDFQVTSTAAVPTVCAGLLGYCSEQKVRLKTLQTVVIGGAACPMSMILRFKEEHGILVKCLWGTLKTLMSMTGAASCLLISFGFFQEVYKTQGKPLGPNRHWRELA